ncbi:MAG TPA: lysophospholipid acyltransferase family protein [Burkholderiales bacterium]|nr:lysophospholipid acyltransferase family protein [Burkholderiales bacterium]
MNQPSLVLRSAVFFVLQAALTIVWSLLSLLTFPFSALTRYRFITTWSRMVIWLARAICGIRYEVLGVEHLPDRPSIVLAKHQSAWETLAFQVFLPPQVWVLKRSLLKVPFFGWGLAMMNPIAIDRTAGIRALKQTLEQGRERLATGFWIVIFPEGHRHLPGEKTTYHVGGAWLAVQTGAPVVPIALNSGYLWRRDAFVKRPGTITVSIGPAIDPRGRKAEELNARVQQWIEDEVERIGDPRLRGDS